MLQFKGGDVTPLLEFPVIVSQRAISWVLLLLFRAVSPILLERREAGRGVYGILSPVPWEEMLQWERARLVIRWAEVFVHQVIVTSSPFMFRKFYFSERAEMMHASHTPWPRISSLTPSFSVYTPLSGTVQPHRASFSLLRWHTGLFQTLSAPQSPL